MFELNLVRERMLVLAVRRKYISYLRMVYALCIIALLVLAVRTVMLATSRSSLMRVNAQLEREIRKAGASYGIDNLNKEWDANLRTAMLAHELMNSRTNWAKRLEEIASLLPEGVQMEKITGTGNSRSMSLELISLVRDSKGIESVDRFISLLEKNPAFGKGVKMESHELRMIDNKETEYFRIAIPLKKT